jgi:hypothetical protein
LNHLYSELTSGTPSVSTLVGVAYGLSDPIAVRVQVSQLADHFGKLKNQIETEVSHDDVHFVSRCDLLGLYQSALSKVFNDIPQLQGYGDKNPIWVTTLLEQAVWNVGAFLNNIYEDEHKQKQPLIVSILTELKKYGNQRAPYIPGVPDSRKLSEDFNQPIALLADWGGDNPAAKKVAAAALREKPAMVIHLGDIYYGGTQLECETFLKLWPMQTDSKVPGSIPTGTSLALNGNHEMYSGGGPYFGTVLPAFGQSHPFFCLEGEYWRLIGLDTAYSGGRLKPQGSDNPITEQWNWLVNILKNGPKRANILLTHHQPVSAHQQEYHDSTALRADIADLMSLVGDDAIYGWFFGHEHRCAAYDDSALPYNARLIGNGCIPHKVQQEKAADPGCTPVAHFNKRPIAPGNNAAVSMYALLRFQDYWLTITYVDEDETAWASEKWDSRKGRAGTEPMIIADQVS